jgi:hypothetical protein
LSPQGDFKEKEKLGNGQVSATGAVRVVSMGGKSFSIPEQVALLLQQAFDASLLMHLNKAQ